MAVEDNLSINDYESLKTSVQKIGPVHVSCEGKQEGGSAASTAAASTGSGGCGGLQSGMLVTVVYGGRPPIWTPTRIELEGWEDRNDVRGSATGMGEVISLVSILKTRMLFDLQARLGRGATDQEQGKFEGKMMETCFQDEVSASDRRCTLTILLEDLAGKHP